MAPRRAGWPSGLRTISSCPFDTRALARASTTSSCSRRRSMSTACSKRSGDVTDADYMARALFLAGRGRGRTSPNPVVGAVIVSPEGVVVGQGYHTRAGEAHAEVHALTMAGIKA